MLFSVIIPTYNRAEKLKIAIESVLKQTFGDFELIIIDDGSTDNTKDLVESFQDPRIIYHYQKNSGLPSVGRNKGLSISNGQWICFLDSDDYWKESKLEVVSQKIVNHPNFTTWSHSEYLIDQNNNIIKTLQHHSNEFKESYFEELLFKGNFLSPSAIAVRKDILLGLDGFDCSSDFFSVEDYELWLRLAKISNIGFIYDILGFYLVDGSGISSQVVKHMNCLKNVYIKHYKLLNLESQHIDSLIAKKVNEINISTSRLLLQQGKFKEARELALQTLHFSLFKIKPYVVILFSLLRIKI